MSLPQFQDETQDEESMVMREIGHLRQLVNLKLDGFEKWLSKLTEAVEKLAENRERTIVLETRMNAVDEKVDDHSRRLSDVEKTVIKQGVIIGAVVGGVNIAIVAGLKLLGLD